MKIQSLLIYTAVLIIVGCAGNGSPPVTPDLPKDPIAVAKADPNPRGINFPVNFSGSDSYDPDGGDLQLFEWDWNNDGTYDETGENVDHTWSEPGTYYVQLRVSDDESETDLLDEPLEIILIDHQPPVACGEADPLTTIVCEPVRFTDCVSIAYDDADIILMEWDWDDDGTYDETGENVDHSWGMPGTFPVMYRVTDSMGATDEIDDPIEINVTNVLPSAIAEADNYNPVATVPVHFDGTGSHDNDCGGDEISKWEWDWDNDGTFDEEGAEVDHFWDFPGTYYVQLRVTDDEGGTDLLDAPIEVIATEPIFNPVDITPRGLNFTPYDIATDGNYAYVAGGSNGLHIFDISDPANPVWVNRVDIKNQANCLAVSGGYAFVMNGYYGFLIIDIDPPESAYIMNIVETESMVKDLAVSDGYVYTASGELQIFDIDPPEFAHLVKTFVMVGIQYVDVSGGYAYCVNSDYPTLLQVIDISPPDSAYIVKSFYANQARNVTASEGYAYLINAHDGFQIIDVEPPDTGYIVSIILTLGKDYEAVVSGGYAYCLAYDYTGNYLHIIDIDPPDSANIVNTVELPWPAGDLAVSNGYAYVTSEGHGLLIIDISTPSEAYIAGAVDSLGDPMGVAVSDGYAYVADSNAGLKIIDIDPPDSTYIVKAVEMRGTAIYVAVSSGYAYCMAPEDSWLKFHIIDIDPPDSAYIVNTVEMGGEFSVYAKGVAASGGYVYWVDNYDGLHIIDIDPPESAYFVNTVITPGYPDSVAVSGGYAYVLDDDGLHIIDIEPPESAYIKSSVLFSGGVLGVASDVAVSGGYAFVTRYYSGFQIIDIDPPFSAYIMNSVATSGDPEYIAVSGGYVYCLASDYKGNYLHIIDIDPPDSAYIVNTSNLPGYASDLTVYGGYAYLADRFSGLWIIKLW